LPRTGGGEGTDCKGIAGDRKGEVQSDGNFLYLDYGGGYK
jgi:hypothetical protein